MEDREVGEGEGHPLRVPLYQQQVQRALKGSTGTLGALHYGTCCAPKYTVGVGWAAGCYDGRDALYHFWPTEQSE